MAWLVGLLVGTRPLPFRPSHSSLGLVWGRGVFPTLVPVVSLGAFYFSWPSHAKEAGLPVVGCEPLSVHGLALCCRAVWCPPAGCQASVCVSGCLWDALVQSLGAVYIVYSTGRVWVAGLCLWGVWPSAVGLDLQFCCTLLSLAS